jgi:bifunctional pyridoxal-dependent enzyme with beta-cystathionase and maltose regulon repressor activities
MPVTRMHSSGCGAAAFAARMRELAHVQLQPAAEFADRHDRHIRFSLAQSPELIETAFSRIADALK